MKTSLACFSVLLLGGCAHLEQAPLVYASKLSIGADVSTASAGTPGISMHVGIKSVDAAYVPVVVARKCHSDSTGIPCFGREYDLMRISGSAKQGMPDAEESPVEAVLIANANKASADYQQALKAEALAKQAALEVQGKLEQLRKSRELQDLSSASLWAEGKGANAIKNSGERIGLPVDKMKLLKDFNTLEQKAQIASAEYAAKRSDSEVKGTILSSERAKLAKSNLGDAYSVFGSFNSSNTGDVKNGANVGLGKVFSTGVAAQQLASGVAAIKCYDLIKARTADTVAATDLERLLLLCK
ncbi:hypothetical protein NB688_003115 [Xanthomonas sacchari]|uniref:Lipoprotein n=1 Tax=Xanthomonas sacchari TaxID=56458 RepID=A0ABT3E083_9XANT|nr:hypothetical protein [Xanthomonas sacchari]MCW0401175.1 hypothetical protein [Xanthomonas sacchari]MCW0420949.1 hypothetical protein [Xanthomonas sacchari]UYK73151.1 hypothetical protein NG828_02075 [Xanthomonas sacchari]